jgi:hypothetical protein
MTVPLNTVPLFYYFPVQVDEKSLYQAINENILIHSDNTFLTLIHPCFSFQTV